MHRPAPNSPWLAGWRAARANLVPGSMVQLAMLALMLAYFHHEPTREMLGRLAATKARWGFTYSALAGVVAGALLPELLRVIAFQRGRPRRRNLARLAFTVPFWAGMALVVDQFYRWQALWFGDEATPAAVIPQVLVDQFLYNPLFAAPVTVWLYDFHNRGGRFHPDSLTARYYRDRIVPTLFATWAVWIPVVTVLYTLPEPLQIPLFALALTLWVLIYTWMSEEKPSGSG